VRAETAINIGYSCRLLTEEMEEVYIVDGDSASTVRRQLEDAVQDMEDKGRDEVDGMPSTVQQQQQQQQRQNDGLWRRNRVDTAPPATVGADLVGFALVITGSSLVRRDQSRLQTPTVYIPGASTAWLLGVNG